MLPEEIIATPIIEKAKTPPIQLSLSMICDEFKIFGVQRSFLQRKYSPKVFSKETWVEILIKEKVIQ